MSSTPPEAGTDTQPAYIRGVPHALPPDERLLWEGAPEASLVAKHVFRRAWVVGYFAIVMAWWVSQTIGTVPTSAFLKMLAVRFLLCAIVVGVVEFFARAVARTTVYALTNKRLVLKIGVVLPMTINVPLRALSDAGVGRFRDGSGQILLSLLPEQRLAYIALWPHVRLLSINQPQPLLRGLSDPDAVASRLRDAIVADAGEAGVQVGARDAADNAAAAGAGVLLPS